MKNVLAKCIGCGYEWYPQLKLQSRKDIRTVEQIEKDLNSGYDCPKEDCKFYGKEFNQKNHWKCKVIE